MQPRPQQGSSLLVAMQVSATDEGIYLARVAFKDPSNKGQVTVAHDTVHMWAGVDVVEHFAAGIGGAVVDAVCWTVS